MRLSMTSPTPPLRIDLADLDRRQIARDVVHPRANGRVDRQETDLDQRLAVLQLGHRLGFQPCRVLIDQAGGSFGQDKASVLLAHVVIVGRRFGRRPHSANKASEPRML